MKFDVREFESVDGRLWLEIFPFVFAPTDRDGNPVWNQMQLLNPRIENMIFTAHGPISDYKVPEDEFNRGLNLLVDSVDWLKDEDFNFDGEWSLAKILGFVTVGRSHDPIGALWIDRLKWIDENVDNFTKQSVDSLRRVDFDRNRRIMHEVNWLSVVFNPSRDRAYPREFTTTELVEYGIDEWSILFARRFPQSNADWETFFENQCENSILRDICEAHFFFERTLDPSPRHVLLDVTRYIGGSNRGNLRERRIGHLDNDGRLRIEEFVARSELDELNYRQFWMDGEQTLLPSDTSIVKTEVNEFADFVAGKNDYLNVHGQIAVTTCQEFLIRFICEHEEMFGEDIVSRVKRIPMDRFVPDWMIENSRWVFDEIKFYDRQPTFNPTGTQGHPARALHNFLLHRGIYEANAVFALSEFIAAISPIAFNQWINDNGAIFENGFRHLPDLASQAEAIMETFWDAIGVDDSE